MSTTMNVSLVSNSKALLGEGPVWNTTTGQLYWLDILEHNLHIHNPGHPQNDDIITIPPYISSVITRQSGGIVLTLQDGFYSYDLSTRELTLLAEVESSLTDNRFNDGKCDPRGRYLAGTMSLSNQLSKGSLYSMDREYKVTTLLTEVSISNGLAWSAEGNTLYFIDTPTRNVVAFDYELETGHISNRRVVVQIPDHLGFPDGMTIDAEGMLWVAHWGGWCVTRWNPLNGQLLQTVPVPASQVTSCTFGGTDLDTLYITTARVGLSEEELSKQPDAGGLFIIKLGITGTSSTAFAG
ncbi:SMP-30/gluconolactonase/LRE family protein [Paenibacillus endoradicis]|uniref:SMP-30/gluconolactonase/LRE family protein n=1 Tax=Paenibacillus endoradicis TaxID=2972487 RepID=UPI00215921EB|nr:SMP-30/gluconolactonase/LRE family protein [Paenibacillus endoradicis]MCR8657472.1 SMP-30/gluconolactonase/LRE family protein [Paenibacillus endoradicis]